MKAGGKPIDTRRMARVRLDRRSFFYFVSGKNDGKLTRVEIARICMHLLAECEAGSYSRSDAFDPVAALKGALG